ncbi:hypothetical protein PspLS_08839 [Pyricularia sp. CBS 133598]|nr:hypothetical protein PspLS_08839 [Pyricularia sp. CBS 133598]
MRDLGRESGKTDVVVKPTALGTTFELGRSANARVHKPQTGSKNVRRMGDDDDDEGPSSRAAKGLLSCRNGVFAVMELFFSFQNRPVPPTVLLKGGRRLRIELNSSSMPSPSVKSKSFRGEAVCPGLSKRPRPSRRRVVGATKPLPSVVSIAGPSQGGALVLKESAARSWWFVRDTLLPRSHPT